VYYTVQSGYDTHSAQLASHGDLLRDFALALKAFINDLKTNQLEHRTLVFVFSEFGRRVEENGSIGTDHGAGAPVFLAGPNLARSIVGPVPDLANLDDGDVRVSIDFRRVYASILDQWMGVSSQEILRAKFEPLSLFKG
jgi:uncharacterized protein (DUF1501 family)